MDLADNSRKPTACRPFLHCPKRIAGVVCADPQNWSGQAKPGQAEPIKLAVLLP